MDFPLLDQETAWQTLEHSGIMLTVNTRSAGALNRQYAEHMEERGKPVFETPGILPLEAWLPQVFQERLFSAHDLEAAAFPVLLAPEQEQLLWESIVFDSDWARGLLRKRETAGLAARAWELCRAWRLDVDLLKDWDSPDYQAFHEWALSFAHRLQEENWLDRASLPDRVAELAASDQIVLPGDMILAGFDTFSPQQLDLLRTFKQAGCRVCRLEFPKHASSPQLFAAQDAARETVSAAFWARQCLESDPGARIGIIVPDLSRRRDELSRVFQKVLQPEEILDFEPDRSRAFNMSLGSGLAEYPIIQAGLEALHLAQDPLPLSRCLFWMHSPFFRGSLTELKGRCRLESRLRQRGEALISRKSFVTHLLQEDETESGPARLCPSLSESFLAFVDLLQAIPPRQLLSNWARDFSKLLEALGWPGEVSLNSREYQCLIAWNKVLQQLAALDLLGRSLDFQSALAQLESLMSQTPFQPEQENVNIQILGLLEAAHEDFDQIWVMGLTDEIWPPAARPHPLLPVPLQQTFAMPHSSAERELEYSTLVLERLVVSAPRVILSYPSAEQDRDLIPTPFITRYPQLSPHTFDSLDADVYWHRVQQVQQLEAFVDQWGPELEPGSLVRGGSGVLKTQSLCPFQAFARYRLGAEDPSEAVSGLGPAERGLLVHAALEFFWAEVQDQQQLLDLRETQLQKVLNRVVERAIRGLRADRALTFTERFTAIEMERLKALLEEWLVEERKRPPFRVIAREQRRRVRIDNLWFRIIVDRLDRLDGGEILVVDYKTGQYSIQDWLGERPAEPQVPFYSFMEEQEPVGVYCGLVRKGTCRYIGIGKEERLIPGTIGFENSDLILNYESWKGLLEYWKERLELLAGELRQGWAKVAPLSRQKSCRLCTLQPLCRIDEMDLLNSHG